MTIVDKASGDQLRLQRRRISHLRRDMVQPGLRRTGAFPSVLAMSSWDVGANQGFFTCYAASKGATVYAFEPVPASYERLIQNVERNGFTDRVVAVRCAI